MPRLVGPSLPGSPPTRRVRPVGDEGRVDGLERTCAAGDGVASPVKLGGLATWQARRAAAAIAGLAGADAEPPGRDEPLLEGVLMTGAEPRPLDERGAGDAGARPVLAARRQGGGALGAATTSATSASRSIPPTRRPPCRCASAPRTSDAARET